MHGPIEGFKSGPRVFPGVFQDGESKTSLPPTPGRALRNTIAKKSISWVLGKGMWPLFQETKTNLSIILHQEGAMLRRAEVGPIMSQSNPLPSNGEETEPGATGPQPIIGHGGMRDIPDVYNAWSDVQGLSIAEGLDRRSPVPSSRPRRVIVPRPTKIHSCSASSFNLTTAIYWRVPTTTALPQPLRSLDQWLVGADGCN